MQTFKSFWNGGIVNRLLVAVVAFFSACSFCSATATMSNLLIPPPSDPTADPAIISTSIVQTIMASIAQTSTAASTATIIPTGTLAETFTPVPTDTPFNPLATSTLASNLPVLPSSAWASCIPAANPPQIGTVIEVIDGDTIRVILEDGLVYSVRYIGIDTPENTSAKEYFGPESSAKNYELVAGKTVTLYSDVSDKDRYGRLLRYVVVDGIFVNHELVAKGYATSVSYPPDTACQGAFEQAQQSATSAKVGLWAGPTPTLLPVAIPGGGSVNPVCICSGNAYNCSDFGSRSAAQACFNYCVSQGAGDVHRLDRDSDGAVCETMP